MRSAEPNAKIMPFSMATSGSLTRTRELLFQCSSISHHIGRGSRWDSPVSMSVVAIFVYAGLGRRVDQVERSVRRGEGDPELAEALRRDAESEWE